MHAVLDKVKAFSEGVRAGEIRGATGKRIRNIVAVGIGGSYLGPACIHEVFKTEAEGSLSSRDFRLRFLSNVDPVDVSRAQVRRRGGGGGGRGGGYDDGALCVGVGGWVGVRACMLAVWVWVLHPPVRYMYIHHSPYTAAIINSHPPRLSFHPPNEPIQSDVVSDSPPSNLPPKKTTHHQEKLITIHIHPHPPKHQEKLDPEETLVIVVSKSFTTAETMLNARSMRQWLWDRMGTGPEVAAKHMAACASASASPLVQRFGIPEDRLFEFWDWVGGRYSVCASPGALPISLKFGFGVFEKFLVWM